MWLLEEKITIGESSHDPREQTGEAGARCGKARNGRRDPAESLLEREHISQNLTQLSRKTALKDPSVGDCQSPPCLRVSRARRAGCRARLETTARLSCKPFRVTSQ